MVHPSRVSSDLASHLLEQLSSCPDFSSLSEIQVAYSGGLDSTVLLHLLHTLKADRRVSVRISAVHIHHGLQAQADTWLDHCAALTSRLQIPFYYRKVQVNLATGSSPEEAARTARYHAFTELLPAAGLLLQAHHQDDQLETVLLHLMRGSGPRGLAGIPVSRTLGAGSLLRPLLTCTRAQLELYAAEHDLSWVSDYSNENQDFDRNFLRHGIVGKLKAHWPGVLDSVSRSAQLCAQADELLMALAAADFTAACGPVSNQLLLSVLAGFSEVRVRNLLRYWVGLHKEQLQGSDITYQALVHTVKDLIPAPADAKALIAWGPAQGRLEIRRFAGKLYLLAPMPTLPAYLLWNTATPLQLPGQLGVLRYVVDNKITNPVLPQFTVRFRQGGETLKIKGRPNKMLKNLLQESAVPPWLRDCVPLIYHKDNLLAVADIFEAEAWDVLKAENSAYIVWDKSDLHCGYQGHLLI